MWKANTVWWRPDSQVHQISVLSPKHVLMRRQLVLLRQENKPTESFEWFALWRRELLCCEADNHYNIVLCL